MSVDSNVTSVHLIGRFFSGEPNAFVFPFTGVCPTFEQLLRITQNRTHTRALGLHKGLEVPVEMRFEDGVVGLLVLFQRFD